MNVNLMAHFIIIFELKLGYRKRCLFQKNKNFALFTVNEKKDKEKLVFELWNLGANVFMLFETMRDCFLQHVSDCLGQTFLNENVL